MTDDQLKSIIGRLDGFAACNLAEPSEGDLERIYEAYKDCFAEVKTLRFEHDHYREQTEYWKSMAAKANQYLKEGKIKFAPNTTNSLVDDWIAEFERQTK
jgi:hypothetical protein